MEVKEFAHKVSGDKIEKELKKEFKFMGRTIKKRRVGIIITVTGVIAALVVILFIRSQRFDVWDYITVSYEGANGYAKPVFTLNKDGLYRQLMGKSDDSDKSYNVKMLISSINVSTDARDVSNGDTYKVNLEFDEKYEDAVGISLGKGYKKIKATGVLKGTSIELFDKVDVLFTGVSPEASVTITNQWDDDYLSGITFSADKSSGIAFGDTVNIKCDVEYEDIARHGFLPSDMEASYTADKLPSYVSKVSDISKKILEQVQQEVLETIDSQVNDNTFRMLYKATKDSAYLYHINNETSSETKILGTYFLKKKGTEGDCNNYIYILASSLVSDSEDSRTVYFAFSYSNAYINVDGTFDMIHDNESKRYVCNTDMDALYQDCIGNRSDNYTVEDIK